MPNYNSIKATIAANVYPNGQGEVTAPMVRTAMYTIVDALEQVDNNLSGKFYGFAPTSADLPAGDDVGYAYVGSSAPFAVWNFDGTSWSDSGVTHTPAEGNGEDIDTDAQGKLQFANRPNTDGMGYVILRTDASFASQVTENNTIYEIRYDFDLGGASVTIPAGCVLKFDGGSINNGTLVFTNTFLFGEPKISARFSGQLSNQIVETKWFDNDHLLQDVFAVSEGCVIEFESKEFQCAYAITIPSCVVHGNGAQIRLLDTDEKASANYDSVFKIANKHFRSATEQDTIIIDHLHFVTASIVGVHLFALSATKNLHLDSCSFICEKPDVVDPTAITLHCFDLDGNDDNVLIENCVFENHCDNGSTENGNGGGVWVRSLVADHPSSNIIFRNCKIYNNCLDEILSFLPLQADINDVQMDGCDLVYERMADTQRVLEGSRNIAIDGSNLVNGITFTNCNFHSNYLHAQIIAGNKFTDGLIKNCSFIVNGYMYPYGQILTNTFNSEGMVYKNCDISLDVTNISGNTESSRKPTLGSVGSKYIDCRVHLGNSRLFLSWTSNILLYSCEIDCVGALLDGNSPVIIQNSCFTINLSSEGSAIIVSNQNPSFPAEWSNNIFRCIGARGNINFPTIDAIFTSRCNIYENFLFSNYLRQTRIDDMTPYGRGDLLKKPAYIPEDFTNGSVVAGDYFVVKGEIKLTSGLFLLANTTLDFTEGGKISGASNLWMDSTRILPEGCKISDFVTAPIRSQSGKVPYATGQVLYQNSRYEMWNGTAWVNLDGSALS